MKTNNLNPPGEKTQKFIEKKEYLEIEDKGATAAEKMAAAAAAKTDEYIEPAKKRNYAGWWAAALFALVAIGCCIYFATRDSKKAEIRTAQTTAISNRHAPFSALKGQIDKASDAISGVSDKAADAGKKIKGTIDNTVNSVKNSVSSSADAVSGYLAGVDVYGKYPKASDDLINQEAADGRKVDYLYYFANNQSAIPDNAVLNDIAEAAKNTDADITITAYASPTGSPAYNAKLCEERAENLEEYFVAHGVDADHIKIVAGGQTAQFGSDAYNRRADILVNYGA